MSLRALRRAVALGFILIFCILRYWKLRLHGPLSLERRAFWLHVSANMALERLGIQCHVEGAPPAHGLLVSNHLGYLDIVILSAAVPCFFVAKEEIDRWPFFGWVARSAGTIFLDRASHASASSVVRQIAERLQFPVPVLLFPEGTSTDGHHVLRFHTRLFEPAVAAGAPVMAAAIRYETSGGVQERELCWFGDDAFLPHLWRMMRAPGFIARIRFGEPRIYPDRQSAASRTHAEVVALRKVSSPAPPLIP